MMNQNRIRFHRCFFCLESIPAKTAKAIKAIIFDKAKACRACYLAILKGEDPGWAPLDWKPPAELRGMKWPRKSYQ